MTIVRRPVLAVVCALLVAATAGAQIDPEADGIGIYADLDGWSSQVQARPGEAFEAYLLLTRPSADTSIAAWECGIEVPANMTVWAWNIQGRYLNVGGDGDFVVGYSEPLPLADAVHLMTFIVVAQDNQPAYFYINESSLDSGGDGVPNYIAGTDYNTLLPLHTWPGGCDQPAFAVNADLQVPADGATWGQVKALFR